MPPTKSKESNTCIKESRSFFKDVIKETFDNLDIYNNLNNTEKSTLRKVQANWIKKYKPDERMPEIPAPVAARRPQNRLRSMTFLPELPKSSIPPKKARRCTISHSVAGQPTVTNTKSSKRLLDRDTDQTQKIEYPDISDVDDYELITMEITVPKLLPHWPCRKLTLNVPSRVQKQNMVEPCLTWDFLTKLMELPEAEGNRMFQSRVEEQLNSN